MAPFVCGGRGFAAAGLACAAVFFFEGFVSFACDFFVEGRDLASAGRGDGRADFRLATLCAAVPAVRLFACDRDFDLAGDLRTGVLAMGFLTLGSRIPG
jgi:hypothetical protein